MDSYFLNAEVENWLMYAEHTRVFALPGDHIASLIKLAVKVWGNKLKLLGFSIQPCGCRVGALLAGTDGSKFEFDTHERILLILRSYNSILRLALSLVRPAFARGVDMLSDN